MLYTQSAPSLSVTNAFRLFCAEIISNITVCSDIGSTAGYNVTILLFFGRKSWEILPNPEDCPKAIGEARGLGTVQGGGQYFPGHLEEKKGYQYSLIKSTAWNFAALGTTSTGGVQDLKRSVQAHIYWGCTDLFKSLTPK